MSKTVDLTKKKIIAAIKVLWQKGYLAAGDGNFSFKDEEGIVWISPSGCRKCDMSPEDFVKLGHSDKASSESLMHSKVYSACEKAKVVFHAHPPTAIAYSISTDEKKLPENVVSELVLSAGKIPMVPYARPGSKDMGEQLNPFLPASRILILKHHGALTWGESIDEALNGMERLEHSCEIFWKAKTIGQLQELPAGELEWLKEKRKSLGDKIL